MPHIRRRSRVPGIIWTVLHLLLVLVMIMLGYQSGLAKSRRSLAVLALVIGFLLAQRKFIAGLTLGGVK